MFKKRETTPDISEELVGELRRVDLFADLELSHLARVAELLEIRSVQPGTEIMSEGRVTYEFFVVLVGTAEASVRGKRRITYGPGEFFGELAILNHQQTATVKAEDQMRLGVIDAKEFKALLSVEPTIAVHMVQSLILRLEDLMSRPAGQLL